MEGSLSKWTNVMKGWQYRWFVLDDNSGLLSYYTSKEKMMRGVRRGCVRLKNAIIGIDDEDDSTFTITVDHKTFHFQARDAEEREKWVQALEDTIFKHGSRMKWDTNQPPPTIKDFQYKVTEADAYLQLMIEQIKILEENISKMSDPEDKSKCQTILEQANVMLDNVKHSIVLLQIAKNTAHPVNGLGLYQIVPGSSSHTTAPMNAETLVPEGPVHGVELGSECRENTRRQSRNLASPTSLAVPDMSYSSSEGEEDFFDANDYPTSVSSVLSPIGLKTFESDGDNNTTNPVQIRQQTPNAVRKVSGKPDDIEQIDDDALYDDDSDENLEIDTNVSVIRHLLSQVKIGMDLTKVVLPTFILERRSLLEMYADYFAHPDLFISIADAKDPRDRMVQVVKWYLASYHAGRKSAVAKKPYNPILGEIFRCHWNIPKSYGKLTPTEETVQEGPITWCTKNQLVFVAEQVSHHPPISAFYAEHYNKRISFNAHVYTKSKFLGLSVCVYNIGQGVVSVLDHDEEYTVTFPNGYGRSILTVPWIELGGSIVINCRKTGYYSNIEFITKPFYGNKKHRISAEIFGPEDKKPFLTISGEWNGIMEAKSNDKQQVEDFVIDVNKLEIVKKLVRPISQQEENESRKVWKDVTLGLKLNDIDKATAAKQKVEQRQRDEAKERKESGGEWNTKLFQKGPEDSWHFINPLRYRLVSNT
ncbi:oxysterol-binding protein-related protein 9 [Coccinella septempunctata]|uniref:oxysterol-binding protein-related protein 9 n=1 Tax=Coccinella septempunctata TaxID=41139 RepID=UPI001D06AFEB|nr:oxysterol-binding protein-related protein 9 [Coccinella septempunctata]